MTSAEEARLPSTRDIPRRKQAETALKQSEQRFARAFRFSPNLVFISTLEDGKFVDVNEAFERGSGYKRDELIGHTLSELGLWPALAERQRIVVALKKSGNLENQEIEFRTKSGESALLMSSMIVVELENQQCLLTIGQDVTARRSAEEALRLSQERFQLMADNIEEIFWLLDPKTLAAVYVSAAFEKICERPSESLRVNPTAYRELIHKDDACRALAALDQLARTGELHEQFRIICPSGAVKWLEVNGFAPKDFAGKVSALVGTVQDITARKKAEQALRASEAEYRSLFFEAPYGICRVKPDGTFIILNHAFADMLGYSSAEELRTKNLAKDVCADPEEQTRTLNQVENVSRLSDIEVQWKRKDGKRILVRASVRSMRDEQGKVEYLEMMVEDITLHKEFQEHFRRMQKMEALALLAGGIAHDFNNILAGILGYGELLLKSLGTDDPRHSRLQSIVNAALQGRNLTAKLHAFTRDETLATYPVNVDREIEQMQDMLRRVIEESIELVFELRQPQASVLLGSGLLYQIILNLAVNARDAMPKGGRLAISTARVEVLHEGAQPAGVPKGQYLLLQVSDTGCGMSKRVKERIFEPFFTTKAGGKGTGLGLFTVFSIVRQCSGYLRVQSKPREGSTFEIYLPLVESSAPGCRSEDDATLPKGSDVLVMVVEDNLRVRNALHDQLRDLGYSVLCEETTSQALIDLAQSSKTIDLVIADVVMPGLNGPDLVEKFRQVTPNLKVLYITGYADPSILSMEALGPGTDLLYKPFTQRDLSLKICSLLAPGTGRGAQR